MSLKTHGVDKYSRLIQQNVDQVRYLAGITESVRNTFKNTRSVTFSSCS